MEGVGDKRHRIVCNLSTEVKEGRKGMEEGKEEEERKERKERKLRKERKKAPPPGLEPGSRG